MLIASSLRFGQVLKWQCSYRLVVCFCTKILEQVFGISCFNKSTVSMLRKAIIPFHAALIRPSGILHPVRPPLVNWRKFRWGSHNQRGWRTCPVRSGWRRLLQRDRRACHEDSQAREQFDHRADAASILGCDQELTEKAQSSLVWSHSLACLEQEAGLETSWGAPDLIILWPYTAVFLLQSWCLISLVSVLNDDQAEIDC